MEREPKRYFEFNEFRIDLEERTLQCSSVPVALTPKVFDLLLELVQNNGRTVTKEALMQHLWADAFVEEGNLTRSISTLRKALGEDAHGARFIRTVPKRGYRFEADVREVTDTHDSITVERTTDYRVALRETTEVRSEIRFSPRLLVGAAVALILVATLAWTQSDRLTSYVMAGSATGRAGTSDPETLALYKNARTLWENRSATGLHLATSDLERAVKLDPEFALAHAALADAYAFDGGKWKDAEAVAREAMRLDPSLGQPYATIGFVRMFWEWNFVSAEENFKEAIARDPNYATAHQWYSLLLAARQLGANSLAEMERAAELAPTSPAINSDLCQALYFSRKYDRAIAQCHKALELEPEFLPAHQLLYSIYTAAGRYDEAVAAYIAAERLNMTSQTQAVDIASSKAAYESSGIEGFWRDQIRAVGAWRSPDTYQMAQYHALLGNKEEALKMLERSFADRGFLVVMFPADPILQLLSLEPGYQDLVRRLEMTVNAPR